ncbi:hypothetical protein F511_02533 [Dorcoceras hygrometricum]|nr:hypothetical protein F511_02533 [Dorcoceras hygrometricum]
MAGMLPGVEAARRRRFSQTSNSNQGANSSLCLYERNHGFRICSSSLMRSSPEIWDQNLDTVAREAKKRLDEKLKTHLKSETKSEHNRIQGFTRARKITRFGGEGERTGNLSTDRKMKSRDRRSKPDPLLHDTVCDSTVVVCSCTSKAYG